MGIFSNIGRILQEFLDPDEFTVPVGDEKEEVTDLFFNPAHRREARAAAGLPDDGKEWCDSCQKSHLPPVCD